VLSSKSEDQMFSSSAYDDPMIQQMNIIRGYIQQARSANRFDEVSMLENNLKELQVEYRRQKVNENETNKDREKAVDSPDGNDRILQNSSQKPLLNKTVFDEEKLKLANGAASNPFGDDDSDTDEYDASGKNPFAE